MATASTGSTKKEKIYSRDAEPQPSTSAPDEPNEVPIFDDSDQAEEGSMPELMALLEDDSILASFENPVTTQYLRQISMDPSVIDSLLEKPEIKFLADKIRAQYEKTAKAKASSGKQ